MKARLNSFATAPQALAAVMPLTEKVESMGLGFRSVPQLKQQAGNEL